MPCRCRSSKSSIKKERAEEISSDYSGAWHYVPRIREFISGDPGSLNDDSNPYIYTQMQSNRPSTSVGVRQCTETACMGFAH